MIGNHTQLTPPLLPPALLSIIEFCTAYNSILILTVEKVPRWRGAGGVWFHGWAKRECFSASILVCTFRGGGVFPVFSLIL